MILNVNEKKISVQITYEVNVHDFSNELLIQWCHFELYYKIITSLESRDKVLHSSIWNDKILNW